MRAGFAMTEVFDDFCTDLDSECIEKYVIPRECSDRGNPFPWRLQNAIAQRAISSLNRKLNRLVGERLIYK